MRIRLLHFCCAVAFGLISGQAHAGQLGGSQQSVFMGNEAALVGGAGLAITTDGGSAWNNPAGLALVPGDSLSLSASALMVRRRNVANVLTVDLSTPDHPERPLTADLRSTEILTVPTTLVRVWRIRDGLGLALGFFTPRSDVFHFRNVSSGSSVDDGGHRLQVTDSVAVSTIANRYQMGPSFGWAPTPWLRVGSSAHVLYDRKSLSLRTVHLAEEGVPDVGESAQLFADSTSVEVFSAGLQGTFGVQLTLPSDVRAGMVVRSPVVQVWHAKDEEWQYAQLRADPGRTPFTRFEHPEQEELPGEQLTVLEPMSLHAGLAVKFPAGWLALDGDLRLGRTDLVRNIVRPMIWNVRAGARFKRGRNNRLAFGVFTDHSRHGPPKDFLAGRVDYYGGTMGIQRLSRFALSGGAEGARIAMMTTLGLRYAVGLGQVLATTVYPRAVDEAQRQVDETRKVMFHEVSLHIGTGILF